MSDVVSTVDEVASCVRPRGRPAKTKPPTRAKRGAPGIAPADFEPHRYRFQSNLFVLLEWLLTLQHQARLRAFDLTPGPFDANRQRRFSLRELEGGVFPAAIGFEIEEMLRSVRLLISEAELHQTVKVVDFDDVILYLHRTITTWRKLP